jgi:hypothetical protein
MSTPAAICSDAARCRRSWNRHRGRPTSATSFRNRCDHRRVPPGAVWPREYQAGVVVDACVGKPFGALSGPPAPQYRDGTGVEVDPAVLASAGLRFADVSPAAELDDLPPDYQHPAVQVHVLPAQPAQFTAAQARVAAEVHERSEPVAVDVIEERAELGRLPRSNLRPPGLRHLGVAGDVAIDLARANRSVQGGMQRRVQPPCGGRPEAPRHTNPGVSAASTSARSSAIRWASSARTMAST